MAFLYGTTLLLSYVYLVPPLLTELFPLWTNYFCESVCLPRQHESQGYRDHILFFRGAWHGALPVIDDAVSVCGSSKAGDLQVS